MHCIYLFFAEFQKLNTVPVCFSARDEKYGTFKTAIPGKIKSFKLVHVSGEVGHFHGRSGNWGSGDISIIITDDSKQILTPPEARISAQSTYVLPGVSANDPELNPPGFNPLLGVASGQQFRVWFGEDYYNSTEGDNHGQSCADIYAHYNG